MIRISVGLETLDDILWDIDNALSITAKSMRMTIIDSRSTPTRRTPTKRPWHSDA